MNRVAAAFVTFAALSLCGALSVAAPAAATATTGGAAPYLAFTVNQTTAVAAVVDATTSTSIAAGNTWGDDLRITATLADGSSMNVATMPPVGQRFTVGSYPLGRGIDATHAAVSVDGHRYTCSTLGGSLTVLQVERGASGQITSFAADYDQNCNYHVGRQAGQIRWNSAIGYAGFRGTSAEAPPQPILEGPGSPITVSLTALGTRPLSPVSVSVVGDPSSSGSFQLQGDTCTGRTLQPGQGCTISATVTPKAFYLIEASVEVVTAEGVTTYLPLYGTGTASSKGTLHPVAAKRVLDTRFGTGGRLGALGAGQTVDLTLGGVGGVPASNVAAAVLNVTVTQPTANSYLTVYPADRPRPGVSSLNFALGQTRANLVTVPVSSDGRVKLTNSAGSTQVIADLIGFYTSTSALAPSIGEGSQLQILTPQRIFASRQSQPLNPSDVLELGIDWFHPEYNQPVTAVLVNITAVTPDKAGFLTAWDGSGAVPTTSTLNFRSWETVPNLAVIPVSKDANGVPTIAIANSSSSSTHLLADLVGIYEQSGGTGLRYRANTPLRIVDTRTGLGGMSPALASGTTHTFTAPVATTTEDTAALVGNLTAVKPTASTYLTAWAYGGTRPGSSTLNASAGTTVANALVAPLGAGARFNLYNQRGSTPALVDVMGTMESYPPRSAGSTAASQQLATHDWTPWRVLTRIR